MIDIDSKIKILLVSGDTDAALHLKTMLRKLGLGNTFTLRTGLEVLPYCAKTPPDLIVCNEQVKFVSGWRLIQEIKLAEDIPNIPVIYFAEKPATADQSTLRQFGVLAALDAPVTEKPFMAALRGVLSYYTQSGSIESDFTVAKESLIAGDLEKAVTAFAKTRKHVDGKIRGSVGLAQTHIKAGEHDKANDIIQSTEFGDNAPLAVIMLKAQLLLKAEQVEDLRALFENTFLENKESPAYFLSAFRLLLRSTERDLLLWVCKAAIDAGHEFVDFYLGLAKRTYDGGDVKGTLLELSRLRKKFGDTIEILNLEAVCLRKLEKFDAALERYEKAISIIGPDARIYFNMAVCLLSAHKTTEAEKKLRLCLEIDPSFSRAADKLSELATSSIETGGNHDRKVS